MAETALDMRQAIRLLAAVAVAVHRLLGQMQVLALVATVVLVQRRLFLAVR
jgi:hypothetical protein